AEFQDRRNEILQDVQAKLFDHFDVPVIERLKITLSETKVFLEKFEKWLWELLRFYFQQRAEFYDDDFTFILDNGEKYTLNKHREDAKRLLVSGPIAQKIIEQGKKEETPLAHLEFCFS